MSIQPVVGLPGAYPPKLSTRREIFLHPDRVSYRFSGRFLHKYAKDWEDLESPNTLKAGTLLALRKMRFPGESQAKLYWFPFVLTANHTSDLNKIVLPEGFKRYAYLFAGTGCKFTRVTLNTTTNTLTFTHVVSNGNVNSTPTSLEISFGGGIDGNWANGSVLLFWGVDGPSDANANPFEYINAFSILPGDTLVTDTHTQLHHYPWSGIVKGDMLYPRHTLSGTDTVRNSVLRRIVKAAASAGHTGLLVDEATSE
jgi:hypothetical protein